MRDRPLLYLCLVIAAAVILSVLLGGERFIRELRPSALEKNISEGAVSYTHLTLPTILLV